MSNSQITKWLCFSLLFRYTEVFLIRWIYFWKSMRIRNSWTLLQMRRCCLDVAVPPCFFVCMDVDWPLTVMKVGCLIGMLLPSHVDRWNESVRFRTTFGPVTWQSIMFTRCSTAPLVFAREAFSRHRRDWLWITTYYFYHHLSYRNCGNRSVMILRRSIIAMLMVSGLRLAVNILVCFVCAHRRD